MIKLNLTAVLVILVLLVLLYFVIDQKFIQSGPPENYDSIVNAKEQRIQVLRWDSTQLARRLRSLEIKSAYDSTVLSITVKRLQHNAGIRKIIYVDYNYSDFNKWLRKQYPRADAQRTLTSDPVKPGLTTGHSSRRQ